MTEFQGWLSKSKKGCSYAYCKCCDKDIKIVSGKEAISKHGKSQSHEKACQSMPKQQILDNMFPNLDKRKQLEEDTKTGNMSIFFSKILFVFIFCFKVR